MYIVVSSRCSGSLGVCYSMATHRVGQCSVVSSLESQTQLVCYLSSSALLVPYLVPCLEG